MPGLPGLKGDLPVTPSWEALDLVRKMKGSGEEASLAETTQGPAMWVFVPAFSWLALEGKADLGLAWDLGDLLWHG